MMKDNEVRVFTLPEAHAYFAVAFNQRIWALLQQEERTPAEDEEMLNAAHASMLHWSAAPQGEPMHHARGLFMLATAYTALRRVSEALHYAKACFDYSEQHASHLEDFDFAYSYLSLARAYAIANDKPTSMQYFTLARQAGNDIADEEDKKIFLNDFRTKI